MVHAMKNPIVSIEENFQNITLDGMNIRINPYSRDYKIQGLYD